MISIITIQRAYRLKLFFPGDNLNMASAVPDTMTALTNNNHPASLNLSDASSIAEFFANKQIFLTGATGFVGQALMEKILRSCPKVRQFYI